jgi:isopentenyl diphosphate isomerase/L-lactate dehydrogenase-like FMN-dependent dehydrogenase/DNA-binding transcriptional MocR family regulator
MPGQVMPTEPRAFSLAEYARLAQERLDPSLWDFYAGGAGDERTLAENTAAFGRTALRPRVLAGVTEPELATKILGRTWRVPFGIAPMAYQTLADPAGELATVRAAGRAGVPVVVSTFSGRDFAELAAAAQSPLWLQLYFFRDRAMTRRIIERAENAGFEAVVLTVDCPRLGRRLRDLRNGFRLPPGTTPANLEPADGSEFTAPAAHALAEFEPALDWGVVEWLRSVTRLPILLKGLMTGADGARAVDAGVDGVIVSNHGGRQLDGVRATLDALPEVAAAVAGGCPVLLDGGVRKGTDVMAALALGADAVLLGRPVLHGLAVAGEQGVTDVLGLLSEELGDAMILTGTPSVADIGLDLVQPEPAQPVQPVQPVQPARPPRPVGAGVLRGQDLYAGIADPVMDTMNFLNEITARYPDAISFAPGRPYDGFFDTEHIFDYLRRYVDDRAARGGTPAQIRDALFQYGPAAGMIREFIAGALRQDEGIEVAPEAIVVTVGCQEAMFLVLRALFARPDDVLLVSTPCYVGITGAARLLGIEVVPVEEGPAGLSPLDLEAAIRAESARGRRVRAAYVIPDHSNPSGVSMPLERRRELLDVAAREGVLLLEDSPYRLVSPGPQIPTLKSLDRDRNVIHLGSFAKTVLPGARVGFAVADQEVGHADGRTVLLADELAKIKSMITVNTPALSQAVIAGALLAGDGGLTGLNREAAGYYGNAMRTTLRELERHFPATARDRLGISWNAPSGGFFLTLGVPFRADNACLTRSAERFGVLWTPMSYFYPGGGGEFTIRLSISYLSDAEIVAGVARLARLVESEFESGSGTAAR